MTTPAAPSGSHERPAVTNPRLPEIVRLVLLFLILLTSIFLPALVFQLPGLSDLAREANASGGPLAVVMIGVAYALTTLVALGLLLVFARQVDRVRLRDYGITWDRLALPGLFIGIVISVVITVVVAGALGPLGLLRGEPDFGGVPTAMFIFVALGQAFLLQGIPEEFIYRGAMINTLQRRGVIAAVWISSIFFGLIHLISAGGQEGLLERVLYLAWPFGFGLAAAALRLVTGSLWTAVGIHGGSHVGVLVCALLGLNVEGPVAWVVIGALYTAIGLWGLRRYKRMGTPDPSLAGLRP
ncbi:hypothetical protein BJY21_001977 [Kineosphaera limosa]|nr:CPBP family intramembrane glutamic endopeptidase [Kineosphaera limosa]NYE00793.1 hypothetical protein [Kineosphaera limosa]